MAVKFGGSSNVITAENVRPFGGTSETGVVDLSKQGVEEVREQYSLDTVQKQYEIEIRKSGVVDALTSKITLDDTSSILEFGKEPAMEMSKVSDMIISKYDGNSTTEINKLVESLLAVMKKIDIEEIKSLKELSASQKKGLFARFKESAEEKLNKLVGKYKGIGSEMEQICNQLNVYTEQIKESNKDIAAMYEAAKKEYKDLLAYIIAGETAIEEIKAYRDEKQKEMNETGNPELQFEVQNINQALSLMERRVANLKGANSLALQQIPEFKIQEYSNAHLSEKINSAFIVTVPAFKSALVNSIIAKQQSIQAQGLSLLDEATSQLIRQNADNAVKQLANAQKLANTSSIKADDIEYAWNSIMNGIQQYKEMEKQYSEIRKQESARIDAANQKYMKSLADGSGI